MKINFRQLYIEKNSLMFITSAVYMLGICSVFSFSPLVVAVCVTLCLGLLAFLNITKIKYLFVWAVVFYLGLYSAMFRVPVSDILFSLAPLDCKITGQIVSIPNSNIQNNTKFFFKVNTLEYDNKKLSDIGAKVFVNLNAVDGVDNVLDSLEVANHYVISGSLRPPFKATNPSQFDYGKYLKNFNAHTVFYADTSAIENVPAKLTKQEEFFQKLNRLRANILTTHAKYLKSPNLELLGGIVFGDDAVAPPDYIKTSFINSGLLHILAASGMNVAFIYGFWFIIAGFFRLPYKLRIITGIPLIVMYALMTGLGASVVRAAIMIVFVLLGKLVDRDSNSIALLSFVAFLMLLVNPSYINDVGFQLSFVVTFGILLMSQLIITIGENSKKRTFTEKILNWFVGLVSVPIIAQIWVMPIQMYYFNTVSTYSVFANILTVPFLSVVSFCGFVSSILAPIKIFGTYICMLLDSILNPFLTVIVKISEFFAFLPNALIVTVHPNLFQVFLYYLIIAGGVFLFKSKLSVKRIFLILISAFFILLSTFIRIPNKNLEVIFFDVQNADCILLKTPTNDYFMIDTGKSGYNNGKSQAEFIVTKYLKDRGIKHLKSIIVTHFDNDHAGGAVDLMKYGKPEKVYLNSRRSDTLTGYNIFKYLKENPEIETCYVENDNVIYDDGKLKLTNFYANISDNDEDNENSIITLAEVYGKRVLFTGDAGVKAIHKIGEENIGKIDVLKIPHHGALNVLDSDIVKVFEPKVSVLSVGRNMYGHPHSKTLSLLSDSSIYRTDRNRALKLVVTPKGYDIYSWDIKDRHFKLLQKF